jgi:hypothetical protein
MPPIYLTRTGIHSRSSIKALGDDAQVAKSGELPPKVWCVSMQSAKPA